MSPTAETRRWHGFGSTDDRAVPASVVSRCTNCGFTCEGELDEARAAFAEHKRERQEGDRDGRRRP